MAFTIGEIKRLGERIVLNKGVVNNSDLELLQEFRTSFTAPLTDTFNRVVELKSKVRESAIVAFRLKRISTIINKKIRKPSQKLNRMGDIAGVRIILDNENEVYKALELIQQEFEQIGELRDYIIKPKKIGYRGVHIYVKDKVLGKSVEIQIRTKKYHNWSTLVEITDYLYGTRLKEIGTSSNPELAEFHSLMSSDKILNDNEADLIYHVLNKYDFITKLSNVFKRNNLEVRKQWVSLNKKSKYFLIEANKSGTPILNSFTNYEKAEIAYFEAYKKNEESEIVLTSINKPTFNDLSIAYANYILSYHTFIKDVEPIIKNLAIRVLEDGEISKFKKIFKTYEKLQASLILDMFFNALDYKDIIFQKDNRILIKVTRKVTKTKREYLQNKLNKNLEKRAKLNTQFIKELREYLPNNRFSNLSCNYFLRKHSKRISKIVRKQKIVIEQN